MNCCRIGGRTPLASEIRPGLARIRATLCWPGAYGLISLLSIGQTLLAVFNAPRAVADKYLIEGLLLTMAATYAKLFNAI
jgi:hypothetical protein